MQTGISIKAAIRAFLLAKTTTKQAQCSGWLFAPCCALALVFCSHCVAENTAHSYAPQPTIDSPTGQGEKNVILFIGDGMDNQIITIARNYLVGAAGKLTLDRMPQRSIAQVLTVAENDPNQVVYVADSANSATAIATGKVTSRGRIATSAGDDRDLVGIAKMAADAGYNTGLVTTASVTDATAAAFYAHISLRECHNPALMQRAVIHGKINIDCSDDLKANGGLGSIAEQLVDAPLDLVLGGGLNHFQNAGEGTNKTLLELAEAAGYSVLGNAQQLQNAKHEERWLGLFAAETMPVALRGENDRKAEKPDRDLLNFIEPREGHITSAEAMRCEENPKFNQVPSLDTMTRRALEKLEKTSSKGFFLMVESASIDKQSHWRNACGSIGEVAQLDQALEAALNYANRHPHTLVLVTADHGQAAQLVPSQSLFASFGVPINTPGKLIKLRTADNAEMVVNYATNDFAMEEHTGVSVPVLSNNAADLPTTILQTELFDVMCEHLGLNTQPLTEANR